MCYFTYWYYGSKHVEPWYLCTRRNLMCVLCIKASSLLRYDTCVFLPVLWFDITLTKRHTTHSGTTGMTQPNKNIFTRSVMCSQQLPLLHWMNNSLKSKIYFPMFFLLKNYLLVKVIHLLIRCYKTRFFLWNTYNIDRNDVNKQITHTPALKITTSQWSLTIATGFVTAETEKFHWTVTMTRNT